MDAHIYVHIHTLNISLNYVLWYILCCTCCQWSIYLSLFYFHSPTFFSKSTANFFCRHRIIFRLTTTQLIHQECQQTNKQTKTNSCAISDKLAFLIFSLPRYKQKNFSRFTQMQHRNHCYHHHHHHHHHHNHFTQTETRNKTLPVVWWATALASMVFPQPGGPYIRTPRGGSIPICLYSSKWVSGSSTASRTSCFWMSMPPMSAYVMFGFSSGHNSGTIYVSD